MSLAAELESAQESGKEFALFLPALPRLLNVGFIRLTIWAISKQIALKGQNDQSDEFGLYSTVSKNRTSLTILKYKNVELSPNLSLQSFRTHGITFIVSVFTP